MTPRVLRAHIKPLPEQTPRFTELERAIGVGVGIDGAWYRSQKEHWLGWLREYEGPGAYGRSDAAKRNGRYIYNHIQCAPMLFWLAEALDCPKDLLDRAFQAVLDAPRNGASQSAALRSCLPWSLIERRLALWPYSIFERLCIRTRM